MKKFKRGGASIFIVIMVSIILSIIVASFVRQTNQDQEGASKQDLSRSAYDSAMSGVEDAKRAISAWKRLCASSDANDQNQCSHLNNVMNADFSGQSCRVLAENFGIGDPNASETLIESAGGGQDLLQAYTCVKLKTDSEDFSGELSANSSKIIPLKSKSPFNQVKISWFSKKDFSGSTLDLPSASGDLTELFSRRGDWPENRPSVLRAHFMISDDGNFNYGDPVAEDARISKTAFLYPSKNALAAPKTLQANEERHDFSKNAIIDVRCSENLQFSASGFACSAILELGREVSDSNLALLRLSSIYGASTNFSVELLNSSSPVDFSGVQAIVDSTGRANSHFRRVQARIELGDSDQMIPEFAVSVGGDFCKKMIIRDSTSPSTYECK